MGLGTVGAVALKSSSIAYDRRIEPEIEFSARTAVRRRTDVRNRSSDDDRLADVRKRYLRFRDRQT